MKKHNLPGFEYLILITPLFTVHVKTGKYHYMKGYLWQISCPVVSPYFSSKRGFVCSLFLTKQNSEWQGISLENLDVTSLTNISQDPNVYIPLCVNKSIAELS